VQLPLVVKEVSVTSRSELSPSTVRDIAPTFLKSAAVAFVPDVKANSVNGMVKKNVLLLLSLST
jgi:hypothetical protein